MKSYVAIDHCASCGKPIGVLMDRGIKDTFDDSQKYTSGDLCDECQEEYEKGQKTLAEGGLAFRCDECGIRGFVIKSEGTREFIEEAREIARREHDWPDDRPLGINFECCQQHISMGIPCPEGISEC